MIVVKASAYPGPSWAAAKKISPPFSRELNCRINSSWYERGNRRSDWGATGTVWKRSHTLGRPGLFALPQRVSLPGAPERKESARPPAAARELVQPRAPLVRRRPLPSAGRPRPRLYGLPPLRVAPGVEKSGLGVRSPTLSPAPLGARGRGWAPSSLDLRAASVPGRKTWGPWTGPDGAGVRAARATPARAGAGARFCQAPGRGLPAGCPEFAGGSVGIGARLDMEPAFGLRLVVAGKVPQAAGDDEA
ncbi:Filamin-A-Interacting Protein 1 [Manis pentadactyla]|nr:Filamin-A-Interacting Protein 1 [Manis pentadactyla]